MHKLVLFENHKELEVLIRRVFDPIELRIYAVRNAEDSLEKVRQVNPCVVMLGLGALAGELSVFVRELRQIHPQQLLVVVGTPEEKPSAEALIAQGVDCVLFRPLDIFELKRFLEKVLLEAREMRTRVSFEPLLATEDYDEVIVARSQRMRDVIQRVVEVANSHSAVVVAGEKGTGKSLVASAIHQHSVRRGQMFLTLDCSNFSTDLIEPNLIPNDRACFQEGKAFHPCRVKQCRGGTLVLDQITEMPLKSQAKLLELFGGGSGRTASESGEPDVRFILTTSEPFEEAVTAGRLCPELADYLGNYLLELPPLRERSEDIRMLMKYFLLKTSRGRCGSRSFSPEVIRTLEHYVWPGNVRELENVICRTAAIARSETIRLGDLPASILDSAGAEHSTIASPSQQHWSNIRLAERPRDWATVSQSLFEWSRKDTKLKIIPAMERELILHALLETKGNQLRAAKLLGISRNTFRKRVEKLKIKQDLIIG